MAADRNRDGHLERLLRACDRRRNGPVGSLVRVRYRVALVHRDGFDYDVPVTRLFLIDIDAGKGVARQTRPPRTWDGS